MKYNVTKLYGKQDYIRKFVYQPGERPKGDVTLNKSLAVYGFRHPSARGGFIVEHYAPFIKELVHL